MRANCSVVIRGDVVSMVLRSDSERFNKEFAAAGEGNKENVIEKWKSLVRRRNEVGDCSVRGDSVNSVVL